jgi:serine/threonine protein kinase
MFTAQVVDWQGKMLGRYRLVHLLGRGGMGEVWQAQDTELSRPVAIKLLPPVLRQEEEYLRAFSNEARTIASLEHPHILAVYDFGEFQCGDEIITYLVMPLVNATLRARIKQQDHTLLPIATSLRYLRQAAEAIDYAHSKRILHRDIKPANMLLQDDWLFLTDFGIARLLTTSTYRSRTHAGAGTPGYMAPEQIQGRSLPASDLYSLAIIAYQLLTGHLPFNGDEPYAIFLKHILHDPPSPRQFNAHLPETMERALLKSLSRQPEERHSSCQAFVAELELGWQESGTNDMSPATPGSFDPDATLLAPRRKRSAASLPAQRAPSPLFPVDDQNELSISDYSTPSTPLEWPGGLESRNGEGSSAEIEPDLKQTASRPSRRTFLLGGTAAALFVAGGGIALSSFYHPPMNRPQKLNAGVPVLKLIGHTEGVNNIRWNPRGRYLVSGGEDSRVLLWDVETLLASSNGKLQSVEQPAASYKPGEGLSTHVLDWSPDGLSLAVRTSKTAWSGYRDAMKIIDIFTPDARSALL